VALGISTGGPKALTEMVPQLPADLPAPLLIVQHMPPVFTKSLADDLNQRTPLCVREGVDGQPIRAGEVWIAPGGRQMKVSGRRGVSCSASRTTRPRTVAGLPSIISSAAWPRSMAAAPWV
jgi:two-component system chemotaxis response regulator CheB